MRVIGTFFIVKLFVLLMVLTGFSVISQAGSFTCAICKNEFDDAYKYKQGASITEAESICMECCNTKNVVTDEALSSRCSEMSLDQKTTDDMASPVCYYPKTSSEAVPMRPKKTNSLKAKRLVMYAKSDSTYEETDSVADYIYPLLIRNFHKFLTTIMPQRGATANYIPPAEIDQNKRVKIILHAAECKDFHQLKTRLNEIKTPDEIKSVHCLNDNCFPDFFVIDKIILDVFQPEQKTYLLEKKTEAMIKSTIMRIEKEIIKRKQRQSKGASKVVYFQLFYFAARNAQDNNIVDYLVIIGIDSSGEGVALYLFDQSDSVLYELPDDAMVKFIGLCQEWAVIHSQPVGLYSFIISQGFIHRQDCERNPFTYQNLKAIVDNFNKVYNMSTVLQNHPTKRWDTLVYLNSLIGFRKTAEAITHNQRPVTTPFVSWYKQICLRKVEKDKTIILKLLGIKAENDKEPLIIITPIDINTCGVNLLQGSSDYFEFPKEFMVILAKQLMFISDGIIAYETQK